MKNLRLTRSLMQVFYSVFSTFHKTEYSKELFFFRVMFFVKKRIQQDPLEITLKALMNLYPLFSLRVKKVAGVKYKIPLYLTSTKSILMSVKFLFHGVKAQDGALSLEEKIAAEIVDAFMLRGYAIKLKDQLYVELDDNRPFLRYLK